MFTLYGRAGWGSVLIEAQLAWYGLPYRLEEVDDLFTSAAARAALAEVNPLAQLPTLVLPDGAVMTESAAITLLLAERTGRAELVPPPGDAARAGFLRWLVFRSPISTRPSPMPTIPAVSSPRPARKPASAPASMAMASACGGWWTRPPEYPGSWESGSRHSTSISVS